ncbi:MAG TPA: class I SAM-dependent methyltransferase [Euryarchaeota archaeon]|nr:MAG: hypothetical protein B6U90_04650 [Thermoplasmatales archaeon ex4484_6]RLF65895.1 MAG: hypothetical protein DRN57_08170 [Thermoplasmata archaeon]HHD16432.1 class I SAM-dependent methyltransferase [Euryarchaeota archaeon]
MIDIPSFMTDEGSKRTSDYGPRTYDLFLAPMEIAWFGRWRRRMLSTLKGEVLDIGTGTGTNLKYYPEDVRCVTVVDPDDDNISYLERRSRGWGFGDDGKCLRTHMGVGEELPFPDETFDAVVSTLILCTVEDPERVVSEGTRVLKRGGRFIFIEHQLPRWKPQAIVFNIISPVWHAPSGCNLNRNTEEMIRSRTELVELETHRTGPILGYPFFIGDFRKRA